MDICVLAAGNMLVDSSRYFRIIDRFSSNGKRAFLILLALAAGCSEAEQISRYAVPKAEETSATEGKTDTASESLFPQTAPMAWFLKAIGPAGDVAAITKEFQSVVDSFKLGNDKPSWTLPDGWRERPGSGLRFATLIAETVNPPIEVSVTQLAMSGSRDEYVQDNVNRWRRQLGLPPADAMDESAGVRRVDSKALDILLVDISGKTQDLEQARMLGAILLPEEARSGSPSTAASSVSRDAASPLSFEQPPEWQTGKQSAMRVAAFEVRDGERQVEITVIPAGGDVLSNVNRWRGQVGLDRWTDAELQEASEQLAVDGQAATYVQLEGDQQTILAAILPDGQRSWFFKLMGDPELAGREENRFKAFVQSVTFD